MSLFSINLLHSIFQPNFPLIRCIKIVGEISELVYTALTVVSKFSLLYIYTRHNRRKQAHNHKNVPPSLGSTYTVSTLCAVYRYMMMSEGMTSRHWTSVLKVALPSMVLIRPLRHKCEQ